MPTPPRKVPFMSDILQKIVAVKHQEIAAALLVRSLATVRAEAEAAELGLGKLAQPLRAALTGRTVSPGIFDVLLLLGRDVSLARLDAAQHYPAGA